MSRILFTGGVACSRGDLVRGGLLWGVPASGGMCLVGGSAPRGVLSGVGGVPAPGGVPGGDPPTATAAGGTHPTGMHSCSFCQRSCKAKKCI